MRLSEVKERKSNLPRWLGCYRNLFYRRSSRFGTSSLASRSCWWVALPCAATRETQVTTTTTSSLSRCACNLEMPAAATSQLSACNWRRTSCSVSTPSCPTWLWRAGTVTFVHQDSGDSSGSPAPAPCTNDPAMRSQTPEYWFIIVWFNNKTLILNNNEFKSKLINIQLIVKHQ